MLELPVAAEEIIEKLAKRNIFIGPPLGMWDEKQKNSVLIAVTEKLSRTELDEFTEIFRQIVL